jgi:hypothetical protein
MPGIDADVAQAEVLVLGWWILMALLVFFRMD